MWNNRGGGFDGDARSGGAEAGTERVYYLGRSAACSRAAAGRGRRRRLAGLGEEEQVVGRCDRDLYERRQEHAQERERQIFLRQSLFDPQTLGHEHMIARDMIGGNGRSHEKNRVCSPCLPSGANSRAGSSCCSQCSRYRRSACRSCPLCRPRHPRLQPRRRPCCSCRQSSWP